MATTAKKLKDFEVNYNKTYEFRIEGGHEGTYILPNSSLVWDEYSEKQRQIRLSDVEESPFVDEQSDTSLVSRQILKFTKGVLRVSGIEKNKVLYLLALDANANKKKTLPNKRYSFKYKLIEPEKTFEEKAKLQKLKLKIQNLVMEASKEDLFDFLSAEYGYQPQTDTIEELQSEASRLAEKDPEFVSRNFKTSETKLKSKFIKAFEDQVLTETKGIVTWTETGLEVAVFKPKADDKIAELLFDWASKDTKESKDFLKKLNEKMGQ